MKLFRTKAELVDFVAAERGRGSVGFVPTMGALHAGHVSLVSRARAENALCVVSIFVNPTQFNDPRDLECYPRTEGADLDLLSAAGVDAVFAPSVAEVYPEPDDRKFDFGAMERVMEGSSRPGHFNGVAQVVSRLFEIVGPDRAYFGEKDFQQLAIIRRMCEMLGGVCASIEIVGCPIVRAQDGLALSSRNALLSADQRAAAPGIYAALQSVARGLDGGCMMDAAELRSWGTELIDGNPLLRTEYFEVVDAVTLQRVDRVEAEAEVRICVAVQCGSVRLIDNIGAVNSANN